jgi:hypothetical protein
MKKLFLSVVVALVSIVVASAEPTRITIITSCGIEVPVDCYDCTITDLVTFAIALDAELCPQEVVD